MAIRVLLVEDQVIIALAEKADLEKHGYQVRIVTSGEKAIAEPLDDIDLILMDIDLGPGIDGVQTASILLGKKKVPLVFLSAHSEPEIVEATEKVTSYGYILKHSNITVLLASIKMAMKLFYAYREIEEKEKVYKQMFEANPNPMWVYDLETLEILMVNNAAVSIYGYSRAEFETMKITDFRPPEDIDRLKDNVRQVTDGLDLAGKWKHILKDGRTVETTIISHTITWNRRKAEVVLSLISGALLG